MASQNLDGTVADCEVSDGPDAPVAPGGGGNVAARYIVVNLTGAGDLPNARTLANAAGETTVTDAGAGLAITVGLAAHGTAATYAYPSSVTTDAKGRVTTVVAGTAPAALSSTLPAAVAAAGAVGAGVTAARADHAHAHGDHLGGTLHALVVAGGAAGFISGTDKTKLDGLGGSVGTPNTYAYPASITTDAQGRVTTVVAGSAPEVPLTFTGGLIRVGNTVAGPVLYYQSIDANGVARTPRPNINFKPRLTATDNASPARTDIDLEVISGLTPGVYTSLNATIDAYGRVTLAASGSGGAPTGTANNMAHFNGSGALAASGITLLSNLWTHAVSSSGGVVGALVSNTSNTASSRAEFLVQVAGATAGDARIGVGVVGGTTWWHSVENASSDRYSIKEGTLTRLGIIGGRAGQAGAEVCINGPAPSATARAFEIRRTGRLRLLRGRLGHGDERVLVGLAHVHHRDQQPVGRRPMRQQQRLRELPRHRHQQFQCHQEHHDWHVRRFEDRHRHRPAGHPGCGQRHPHDLPGCGDVRHHLRRLGRGHRLAGVNEHGSHTDQ